MTTSDLTASNASATSQPSAAADGERTDLLATLRQRRNFLRLTTRDLTDDQARERSTVSELCLGGLIKHVTSAEEGWVNFILDGPSALGSVTDMTEEDYARRADEFRLLPGETLAAVLAAYAEVAQRTDELIITLPSLDDGHLLPEAPWFEPNTRWSARRVLLHIMTETTQHAGHADIIREAIDGAKTMG